MALNVGQRIGGYEITGSLGAGGMGEVYGATDTTLGRGVAIKVLPTEFAGDPDRLARFEREARALASLNHPNIAVVHGLERAGTVTALVMELVDGPTLADRIAQGALAINEALPIARQIAEGLEAAHERGIVHRDLKPANVKVRDDGTVKVLDFGLAKVFDSDPQRSGGLSMSPTITTPATAAGVILGTAAYMAPEQARGRKVDKRADIWAFGCVLYEMLTGRRAFPGEDVSETLAAVLKQEPDWSLLPRATPTVIRRLLQRCLARDVRQRLPDIGVVRLDIADALLPTGEASNEPVHATRREQLLWVAVGVLLVAASAGLAMAYRAAARVPALPEEMRLDVVLPPDTNLRDVSISPDGRQLAIGTARHLSLRSLQSETTQPIPATEGMLAAGPFWAPDSRSIAFFDLPTQLKRIDLATGLVRNLAPAPQALGGSWGSSGTILFAPSLLSPIYRIAEAGGAASPATRLAKGHQGHRFPQFLPDGRHFIFLAVGTPDSRGLYVSSLDDPDHARRLVDTDMGAVVAPPDTLLFMRNGVLMAQRLDLEGLQLRGDAEPVASRVVAISNQFNTLLASASHTGSIIYRRDLGQRQLVWFDRSGRQLETVGEPDDGQQSGFSLGSGRMSRDGRYLTVQRTVNGNADIWLVDLLRGSRTRLTSEEVRDGGGVWSHDATRLVFFSERNGIYDLYEKPADGSKSATLLYASAEHKAAEDWSADDRFILYDAQHPGGRDLWALPLTGDRKPIPVATTRFEEWNGQFSPDGHWVTYQSDESGRPEIYLQPFPGPGRRVQVSTNRGTGPRWRQDGNELFYTGPDNRLMSVSVSLNGSEPKVGVPTMLFMAVDELFLPSPDGQRFLYSKLVRDPEPLTLLLNWARPAK